MLREMVYRVVKVEYRHMIETGELPRHSLAALHLERSADVCLDCTDQPIHGHDREPAGHARPDDDECLVRDHDGVYPYAPPRDRRVVGNLVCVYSFCFSKPPQTNILTSRYNIVNKRPLARSHSAPARARASTRPGRRNSSGTPRRRPRR